MEVKDEGVKKGQRKYSVFDGEVLKTELENFGVKTLHVFTIWTYVLAHLDAEAHDVPGLPHGAVELLRDRFRTLTSKVQCQQTSADGSTTKILIHLQSGQSVEAVIMRHDAGAGKYAGDLVKEALEPPFVFHPRWDAKWDVHSVQLEPWA